MELRPKMKAHVTFRHLYLKNIRSLTSQKPLTMQWPTQRLSSTKRVEQTQCRGHEEGRFWLSRRQRAAIGSHNYSTAWGWGVQLTCRRCRTLYKTGQISASPDDRMHRTRASLSRRWSHGVLYTSTLVCSNIELHGWNARNAERACGNHHQSLGWQWLVLAFDLLDGVTSVYVVQGGEVGGVKKSMMR